MLNHAQEHAWLTAMREAALPAIRMAAEQMQDPKAADVWRETGHDISFDDPDRVSAALYFSRPEIGGEPPREGVTAMVFDYLPYVVPPRRNSLFDAGIRSAILRQIRGRMRDAETARLSPGIVNPAWAITVDILSWCALSAYLSPEEIAAFVSETIPESQDAEVLPVLTIDRQWQPYGSDASGLLHCHLTPSVGRVAVDGLELRPGLPGSPRVRIENDAKRGHIHIEVHGVNLPETAIYKAVDGPLSKLIDDPVLSPAARRLTVRSVKNHMQKDEPILSIVCDEIRIRCAPPPAGATFSWETMRDPLREYPRLPVVLEHGALQG